MGWPIFGGELLVLGSVKETAKTKIEFTPKNGRGGEKKMLGASLESLNFNVSRSFCWIHCLGKWTDLCKNID